MVVDVVIHETPFNHLTTIVSASYFCFAALISNMVVHIAQDQFLATVQETLYFTVWAHFIYVLFIVLPQYMATYLLFVWTRKKCIATLLYMLVLLCSLYDHRAAIIWTLD